MSLTSTAVETSSPFLSLTKAPSSLRQKESGIISAVLLAVMIE